MDQLAKKILTLKHKHSCRTISRPNNCNEEWRKKKRTKECVHVILHHRELNKSPGYHCLCHAEDWQQKSFVQVRDSFSNVCKKEANQNLNWNTFGTFLSDDLLSNWHRNKQDKIPCRGWLSCVLPEKAVSCHAPGGWDSYKLESAEEQSVRQRKQQKMFCMFVHRVQEFVQGCAVPL